MGEKLSVSSVCRWLVHQKDFPHRLFQGRKNVKAIHWIDAKLAAYWPEHSTRLCQSEWFSGVKREKKYMDKQKLLPVYFCEKCGEANRDKKICDYCRDIDKARDQEQKQWI